MACLGVSEQNNKKVLIGNGFTAACGGVIQSITDNNNLFLDNSEEGNVYIPSFGNNTIGNLKPRIGYRVYITNSDSLIYPNN